MLPFGCYCWLVLWLVSFPVDKIVAVVEQQVLTESELLAEIRLALLLRHGPKVAALDLETEQVLIMRRYVLDQWIFMAARRRLPQQDVARQLVEENYQQLVAQFASPTAYRAWLRRYGWSQDWVKAVLRRNLLNEQLLVERLRARLGSEPMAEQTWQQEGQQLLRDLEQGLSILVDGPEGDLEPGSW